MPKISVLRFWRRRRDPGRPAQATECALAACAAGRRALVLVLGCSAYDANRLRILGVCEGAPVGIVDTRRGILLDVRGARFALDTGLARSITVRPIAA